MSYSLSVTTSVWNAIRFVLTGLLIDVILVPLVRLNMAKLRGRSVRQGHAVPPAETEFGRLLRPSLHSQPESYRTRMLINLCLTLLMYAGTLMLEYGSKDAITSSKRDITSSLLSHEDFRGGMMYFRAPETVSNDTLEDVRFASTWTSQSCSDVESVPEGALQIPSNLSQGGLKSHFWRIGQEILGIMHDRKTGMAIFTKTEDGLEFARHTTWRRPDLHDIHSIELPPGHGQRYVNAEDILSSSATDLESIMKVLMMMSLNAEGFTGQMDGPSYPEYASVPLILDPGSLYNGPLNGSYVVSEPTHLARLLAIALNSEGALWITVRSVQTANRVICLRSLTKPVALRTFSWYAINSMTDEHRVPVIHLSVSDVFSVSSQHSMELILFYEHSSGQCGFLFPSLVCTEWRKNETVFTYGTIRSYEETESVFRILRNLEKVARGRMKQDAALEIMANGLIKQLLIKGDVQQNSNAFEGRLLGVADTAERIMLFGGRESGNVPGQIKETSIKAHVDTLFFSGITVFGALIVGMCVVAVALRHEITVDCGLSLARLQNEHFLLGRPSASRSRRLLPIGTYMPEWANGKMHFGVLPPGVEATKAANFDDISNDDTSNKHLT